MKVSFSSLRPIFALFFALAIGAKSEVNSSGVQNVQNVQTTYPLDSIAPDQLDMNLASIPQNWLDVLVNRKDIVNAMLRVQEWEVTLASSDLVNHLINLEAQLSLINRAIPSQSMYPVLKSIKGLRNKIYSGRNLSIQYVLDIWNPILDSLVRFQAAVRYAKREVLAAIPQESLDRLATRTEALTAMLIAQDQNATLDNLLLSSYLIQLQNQLIPINSVSYFEYAAANLLTVVKEMVARIQPGTRFTVPIVQHWWNNLLANIIAFQANVANAKASRPT